ncbi:MAG: CAP domain-containing protein [Candidatus Brocadiia bacterium]
MRKPISSAVALVCLSSLLLCNAAGEAAKVYKWEKARVKYLSYPGKGVINALPAYRHLPSSEEDFLSFSFCPSAKYKLQGNSLLVKTSDEWRELVKGASVDIPLDFPDGSKKRVAFEIFPPDDPDHFSTNLDKIQWKIRNPTILGFTMGESEFIVLDTDANGSFGDLGVDKLSLVSHDAIGKGTVDVSSMKFVTFDGWVEVGTAKYFLDYSNGGVSFCRMPDAYVSDVGRSLGYLNDIRRQCGSPAVLPDPDLSDALLKHCNYCTQGKVVRDEDPKSYFYDAVAARAARNSFVSQAFNACSGMYAALSTLYSRNMLLSPKIRSIGIALDRNIFCVGGQKAAFDDKFIRCYPSPGQRRVQLRFSTDEPSPLKKGTESFSGTFVVLGGVPPTAVVISAEISQVKATAPMKVSCSSPTDIPNDDVQAIWPDNKLGIAIIPDEVLKLGNCYRAKVQYKDNPMATPREFEWFFYTEEVPFK